MKRLFLLTGIAVLLLCGCGNNESQGKHGDEAKRIADAFFKGNYAYKEMLYEGDDVISVIQGKVINSPYQEYKKRTEGESPAIWEELYCYGSGKVVNALIKSKDTWEKSVMNKERPYGYGEELEFEFVNEEQTEQGMVSVYQTGYSVELGENFLEQSIEAEVRQTYYLDMEKECVTRIDTDLTELNRYTEALNEIMVNGKVMEEALEEAERSEEPTRKVELYVSDFGGIEEIENPQNSK